MDRFLITIASCAMPIAFLVVIFGTIVMMRWFKHREIMTLAEKGLLPEQYAQYMSASRRRNGRGLFGWGIALAALGLALVIGLWPVGFTVEEPYPFHFGPWMLIGLIPLFIGLALLSTYFLTRQEEASAPEALLGEENTSPTSLQEPGSPSASGPTQVPGSG